MNKTLQFISIALASVALASLNAGREFTYSGNLTNLNDSSAWVPTGVPGSADTVVINNGNPLFINQSTTVANWLSTGNQSEQIIGRSGHQTLHITGALRVDRTGGVARFRGHVSNDNSQTLSLQMGSLELNPRSRLRLGEFTEGQSDRALRGLKVNATSRIAAGAVVEVFTADNVDAQFGPVSIEGDGMLLLNVGPNVTRSVRIAGLNGAPSSQLANSRLDRNSDFANATTILHLSPQTDRYEFAGTIRGRLNDDNNNGRIYLVKQGAGIQILAGDNHINGSTRVEEGTLIINGKHHSGGSMDVLSGAAVGGAGKLLGSLTINHGARFYFDPQATLTVSAQVWLSRDFGVSSLIGLDDNTAGGRYLLIENPLFRPQPGLFQNIGRENAVAIGQGKQAWFEGPGLQLVVD